MTKDPTPEDWKRANSGFREVIDGLKESGIDPSKDTTLKIDDEEHQKRGIPLEVMAAMAMQLGSRVSFTDVHEINSELHAEQVDCIITGIFIDGFAYRKITKG